MTRAYSIVATSGVLGLGRVSPPQPQFFHRGTWRGDFGFRPVPFPSSSHGNNRYRGLRLLSGSVYNDIPLLIKAHKHKWRPGKNQVQLPPIIMQERPAVGWVKQLWDIVTWTPLQCRWNPEKPPSFNLALNLLFGFAATFTVCPLFSAQSSHCSV